MDTTTAFQIVRQALATIVALQPLAGRASTVGTMLIVRQADGTSESYAYQHVAGGTMRCIHQTFDDALIVTDTGIAPLDTLQAVTDHARALVVETLR